MELGAVSTVAVFSGCSFILADIETALRLDARDNRHVMRATFSQAPVKVFSELSACRPLKFYLNHLRILDRRSQISDLKFKPQNLMLNLKDKLQV
jgi:hypothetical protein